MAPSPNPKSGATRGDVPRPRSPPQSQSAQKFSPSYWRRTAKTIADRPGTIPLLLFALVALTLATSSFSELQFTGDHVDRVLAALVPSRGDVSGADLRGGGFVKRHSVRFPRLLHAAGEEGLEDGLDSAMRLATRAERQTREGKRSRVAMIDVSGFGFADNQTIGVVRTSLNPAGFDFPAVVNNSSVTVSNLSLFGDYPGILVGPELSSGVVNAAEKNNSSDTTSPESVHTGVVSISNTSTNGTSYTANLTLANKPSPVNSVENTGNGSIISAASISGRRLIPSPEFWPRAYYKQGSSQRCDLGDGKWVLGTTRKPISNCSYAAQRNERCAWRFEREPNYRDYTWQPRGCELPPFDARSFLRQWRDKTIIVAGDSLGRNFYGSLMCQVSAGGSLALNATATRAAGFQIFRNEEHNITIGRAMSEFLVKKEVSQEAFARLNQTAGNNRFIVQLDQPDTLWAKFLPRADLLVLNSGHWWMGGGKEKLFMLGGKYRPDLTWTRAYLIGMKHIRKAVERSSFHGTAIFRTFSPSHYAKGGWNSGGTCDGTEPRTEIHLDPYVRNFLNMTRAVFDNSTFQVMEISRLSSYRTDGHVGPIAKANATRGVQADCTHWCAEGVTDAWVDILQAMLRAYD